jgi:PAS domain S-box-containing protein
MSVLGIAFFLRLLALVWSIHLVRQMRDRRLWALVAFVALATLMPVVEALKTSALTGVKGDIYEFLDDFVASDFILLGVLLLGRLMKQWRTALSTAVASEERYRGLMEQSADAVFVHTDGRFVFANRAAAELLGAPSAEALIGLSVVDRVHPDYREGVRSRIDALLASTGTRQIPLNEEKLLRLDGSVLDAEISATSCEWDGARAVQVVARNISERKRAEKNLLESREVLEKAQAVAHVGSWVWTSAGHPELVWSAETFRIFGVNPETFDGTLAAFLERVHPDDSALVHETSERARAEKRTFSVDHRIIRPDGQIRWVHEEADVVQRPDGSEQMTGAVQDITERKLAQQALEESELRYRQLFRLNPEPMWVYNTDSGRFLAVNEASLKRYGYARDEFLRMTVDELSAGGNGNGDVRTHVADEDAEGSGPERHKRKDGSVIDVEVVGQSVPFIGPWARLVVARDVSEQRRAQSLRAGHARVLEMAARGEPMEAVLTALAQTYNDQVDGAEFAVYLLSRDGSTLVAPVAPRLSREFLERADGVPIVEKGAPSGFAVARRVRTVAPDIAADHDLPGWARDHLLASGFRAVWAQPIIGAGERALGTVTAYVRAAREPSEREAQLLESAASLAGVAIERRRAEEALREANDRLRAIIWSSPLPIMALDMDGRIRLWNKKSEEVFGWREEEVLGRPNPVVPADRTAEFEGNLQRCLSGESIYGKEMKRKRKDGTQLDVSLSAAPLYGPNGEPSGALAVVADITQSKSTERALRESEERLEYAQQCAEAGTWDMDMISREGRWSSAYCRLFGSEPVEGPTGSDYWESLLLPEDLSRIRCELGAKFAERSLVFQIEFRAKHPTRGVRWFTSMGRIMYADDGRVARMAGITMDIDDRKRAQDAATEWSARYEAAVRASRQLLYDWDPRTNTLVWGGNATEILGFGLGELGDLDHWIELVHPDDRKALRDGIDRLIATREPFTLEHRVRRRDGQYIEVQDTGSYYDDPAGGGGRMIGFVSDITQRKRLEAELRQTQKLDAIGRLASGVSHDFNNLLTAIFGYTSLARRTLSPNHPATRSLDRVDDAARQASGVTKGLLTFSRESSSEKRPINLARTIDESLRLLRRTLPATITLQSDLGQTPPPWVRGDATQLQQIMLNLAINARDAMPAGGMLKVQLRRAERDGRPIARLTVSDTGTGIPPEVLPRIFEPFFTTKPPELGTGLGLAIIHGIVSDHDGHVEVRSEPGHGATFIVELPRCDPAPIDSGAAVPVAPATGQGELIILGDNHTYVREIVSTMLQSMGFRVLQAPDGGAALELYQSNRGRAKLLLLDEDMPGCSGWGCVHAVREQGDATPAVIMASAPPPDDGVPSHTAVLRKPFQISELSSSVTSALGVRSAELENT